MSTELVSPHATASQMKSTRAARLAGVLLILAAAILYFATLDTGLQPRELEGGDLITHQYAQVEGRPSNAPGYPIYTMGGWLWFHGLRGALRLLSINQPNPLPILSSYSTVWALLALWLLYAIILHLTKRPAAPAGNWPVAWLLAAFYGLSYFFWYYATTTEQYSSAIAQTLGILYLYLLWDDAPDGPLWRMYALAFLCGLSLAHMLTVAFIVPPVVLAVIWRRPGLLRDGRAVAGSVVAALLALISYAYVYIRGAGHPEWWGSEEWPSSAAWFWAFVSTAQGREELMWGFEPGRAFFGNGFPELIWRELSLPLLILGLVGISLLQRRHAVVLYATLLIYAIFDWAYRYGNWYQVILPAYPLILIGDAALVDRFQIWAAGRSQPRIRQLLSALPLVLLAALDIWRGSASLPAANSRDRAGDSALDRGAILLERPLPPNTALFAAVNDALALQYLTRIWDVQPTLEVVSSATASARLSQGRPVLATVDAAGTLLAELKDVSPPSTQNAGPLWIALIPAQGIQPGLAQWIVGRPTISATQAVTAGVSLLGYSISPAPQPAVDPGSIPPAADVTLYWRLEDGTWPEGLSISVRPTLARAFIPHPERAGEIIQEDRPRPVSGLYAPPAGDRPAIVADAYRFVLPAPLPDGADGVSVLLYRVRDDGFENVARLDLPLQ